MRKQTAFALLVLFLFCLGVLLVPKAWATVRIMPLGDSITNGNASGVVPDNSGYYISYRKALWDRLVVAPYDVDFVGSLNSGSAVFSSSDLADHDGHPGWTDEEIVTGNPAEPERGKLIDWLITHQPDIILLHIGTNGLESSPADVEAILDVIDQYSTDVWVVLARIINRNCKLATPPCSQSATTTVFNDNVAAMVESRIDGGDRIVLVDMENGAGIDYRLYPYGDMWDNLHPFQTGYAKMAEVWFAALEQILPLVDGTDARLDRIEIEGPSTVEETSGANYACRAYYLNGTSRFVAANEWTEDSAYTEITAMGHLTTLDVPAEELVSIRASYTEGGLTVSATYNVTITDVAAETLESGVSKTGSVSQGEWAYYRIDASASDTQLKAELTNLSADVDLYVLAGSQPTLTNYTCRPYKGGTSPETCTLANSGATTWYIGVHGYRAGSFTVKATLAGGGGGGPVVLQSGVSKTGSVSQGKWAYYRIDASASDTQLKAELTNLSADVDLYVLAGSQPTLTNYICRPYKGGTSAETCTLANSGATTWYIGVHGYRAGSFTVKATLTGNSGGQVILEAAYSVDVKNNGNIYYHDGSDWVGRGPSGSFRTATLWDISSINPAWDVVAVEVRFFCESKTRAPGAISVARYGSSHGEDDPRSDPGVDVYSKSGGNTYASFPEPSSGSWTGWVNLGNAAALDIEWCRDNDEPTWSVGLKASGAVEAGTTVRHVDLSEDNEVTDAELRITYTQ